jgi:hypothetical protein
MFSANFGSSTRTDLDLSGNLYSIYADSTRGKAESVDDSMITKLLEDPLFDRKNVGEGNFSIDDHTLINTINNGSPTFRENGNKHHCDDIWDLAGPLSDPLSSTTSSSSPSTAYLYHHLKHSLLNADGSLNGNTYRYIKNILTSKRDRALNDQQVHCTIDIRDISHTSYDVCLRRLFQESNGGNEFEGEEVEESELNQEVLSLKDVLRQRRKVMSLLHQK